MQKNLTVKLKNKMPELDRLQQEFEAFSEQNELAMKVNFALNLTFDELITNTISYGYDDSEEHEIIVNLRLEDAKLYVLIEDDGLDFNPLDAPEPDIARPLEDKPIGGLGIHLVRKYVSGLSYERKDDLNKLSFYVKLNDD